MPAKNPTPKRSGKQPLALAMLIEDHRLLQSLFEDFASADDEDDADEREAIIDEVCDALTAHALLEEDIFYPSVEDEIEEINLVREARLEHDIVKELVARLQEGELDNPNRVAVFNVLVKYVQRHVEEEEGVLFKQVKATRIDLDDLGEEMTARKAEIESELGLDEDEEAEEAAAEEEEEEAPEPPAKRKRGKGKPH